jgi:hypothetical protein
MDQTRANLNSSQSILVPDFYTEQDTKPTPNPERTHAIFIGTQQVTGCVHSDQTGRFPLVSTSGHNYIMVVYYYNLNYILLTRGRKPQLQRLDNKVSTALIQFMAEQNVDVQLSPPHIHRRNAAERAIRTFKNHCLLDGRGLSHNPVGQTPSSGGTDAEPPPKEPDAFPDDGVRPHSRVV